MNQPTLEQLYDEAKRHHQAGRLPEAEGLYRQMISRDADNADAQHLLGVIAFQSGRRDEALERIGRAIQIDPRRAEFHANLGLVLADSDPEQAIAAFRRAIAIRPDFVAALKNLGTYLGDLGRLDEGAEILGRALNLGGDVAESLSQIALSLRAIARVQESLKIYDSILAARPDHSIIHGDRCYLLQLLPEYDAPAILREHLEWNRRHAEPLASKIVRHSNDRNPDRRLRVGYVSPDFKYHCQQFFMAPLLSRHDHGQFEIYCYARVAEPDEVTQEMRTRYADVWRDTVNQSDEEVAGQIREDKIDILVDLTMHMPAGRPLLFARKPAPVSITWLAYPGTTGMPAIDYRLTDPYLDPPGQTDSYYAEKSIRLPDTFWCYDPRTS
ncbi:MAG: tetratricopeptide repeat protein, partial [Tepidisphaeraceae bacterium]